MSTTNTYINTILETKGPILNEEYFYSKVKKTDTIELNNTFIKYCPTLKIVICPKCSININKNILEHIKKEHKTIYKSYKTNNLIDSLEETFNTLELNTIEDLKRDLKDNTYYLEDLPITFNNYKCKECFKTSTSLKFIRIHLNKEHNLSNIKDNNNNNIYILDKVPLQTLKGFKIVRNISFIPKLEEEINRESNIDINSPNN